MPFTPFHMGPACVVKAIAGGSFSLTVYGFASVAMDVEPLIHLLRGERIAHGFSHTFLCATAIALFSILAGRPVCQLLLKLWNPRPQDRFERWLRGPRVITWTSAIIAALAGTWGHVVMDAMIHADVLPFAPFSEDNPMLSVMSFGAMHLLCVGIGVLGLVGLTVRYHVEAGG